MGEVAMLMILRSQRKRESDDSEAVEELME
jgi:preprotein translocase subunit YajC